MSKVALYHTAGYQGIVTPFWPKSIILSVGPTLCLHSIAYRRTCRLSSVGPMVYLFKKVC